MIRFNLFKKTETVNPDSNKNIDEKESHFIPIFICSASCKVAWFLYRRIFLSGNFTWGYSIKKFTEWPDTCSKYLAW